MSFGYAVGDFISAGTLAWNLYTKCYLVIQDAPQEFRDLVDSLNSVRIAMVKLEEETKNPDSALSRSGKDRVQNVISMVGAITRTLKGVEKLVNRYQIIVEPTGDLGSYGRRLWSKLKWSAEVKKIEDLKQKLMFHTGTVNLYLMTVGNSSLGRIETILHTLVAAVSPPTGGTLLHPPAHEPSLINSNSHDTSAGAYNSSLGSRPFELSRIDQDQATELPGSDQSQAAELPRNDRHRRSEIPGGGRQVSELPGSPMEFTEEETVALEEILTEADEKLVRHGRPAVLPSRRNTIRSSHSVRRRAVPNPQNKQPGLDPGPGNILRHPSPSGRAPSNPTVFQDQTVSNGSTLRGSVNYMPNGVVEKAFVEYKSKFSGTRRWPSNFTLWLRVAEWWFLKGKLSREEQGIMSSQAYVNFTKCSWILSQLIQQNDDFSYDMSGECFSSYSRLLKKVEMDYLDQDLDAPIPKTNSDLYSMNLGLLEPTQPEEEHAYDISVPPQQEGFDIFNHVEQKNLNTVFRSFVAIEFGFSRPSQPPADSARSYLLSLYFNPHAQTAWIYICNQSGSLGIVKSLNETNIGNEFNGANLKDWMDLEFNGQAAYAGFSSMEAAVPYAVEYNSIRRQLLESPTCIIEITVEKARYMSQGQMIDPVGVGPSLLSLMEMNKAEDRQSRYRELVMHGHFTTKEIPFHVIKIIQSPSSNIRVQLWWPTFNIPREDLRDFANCMIPSMTNEPKAFIDEFYTNPHVRKNYSKYNLWLAGIFVDIRYRPIEDRLLDIDLKMRSDRMLDAIFRTPEDARKFIAHVGGTAPQVTERMVFQKVTANKEIRLFRDIDEKVRLSYKESDTYCNFIVDHFSSYNITPQGGVSLWTIMWSPFGKVPRGNLSYLNDSIDLGILETSERNDFLAALVFPEQEMKCASMRIIDFTGVRGHGGFIGRINKAIMINARASAKEAMLVLRLFGGVLHVTVFGKIEYKHRSRPNESMKLMAKVVAFDGEKLSQTNNHEDKLSIVFSVSDTELYSFNRERSLIKGAKNPTPEKSEIGGLRFTVGDISEWRAASANLGLTDMFR